MEYQEAVDTILQFTGETPVNAPNVHPNQGVIERYLNNSSSREQLLEWWFNLDHDVYLLKDVETTQVAIPSTIKKIVFDNPDYVDRGTFVYDKVNNTYLIDEDVLAIETVKVLSWTELPELMQQWIMFQAAKYYIISTIGDQGVTKELKEEASRTYIMLKSQDLKSRNINIFNTPQIARNRMGRQPYIRR